MAICGLRACSFAVYSDPYGIMGSGIHFRSNSKALDLESLEKLGQSCTAEYFYFWVPNIHLHIDMQGPYKQVGVGSSKVRFSAPAALSSDQRGAGEFGKLRFGV